MSRLNNMTRDTQPAGSLYIGKTVHERRAPFLHRFSYRLASVLLDLDQLKAADQVSALFSVGRFNLYSFYPKDLGPRDGGDLSSWARNLFASSGVEVDEQDQISLLCAPRVLGYQFNPLSIYFAHDAEGQLKGLIYEVHNTFGDSHCYVAKASEGSRQTHDAEKIFHVSPFFDLGGRYEFTLREPDDTFHLTIFKQREDGPDFLATMAMKRAPLSTARLARLFLTQPFSSLKTILAIHWEALRLWIKGAVYHKRNPPPADASMAHPVSRPSRAEFGAAPD
ncbi:DUF1365 domain-containing protein [Oceanicaulis alexandrii]|uniref:DUF1365 domain-containing protein n=1 Tax=Oceanicaulis alexandrii TaxID=153233 RepID=UPI002355EAA9|nr:DUF1365 domain-containing protein [Oceanicaulis alexandrii]